MNRRQFLLGASTLVAVAPLPIVRPGWYRLLTSWSLDPKPYIVKGITFDAATAATYRRGFLTGRANGAYGTMPRLYMVPR